MMERLRPFGPTFARLALGAITLMHGLRNLGMLGGNTADLATWIGKHAPWVSMPPETVAWSLAIAELVAGILLVLGTLAPLAALVALGLSVGVLVADRKYQGFFLEQGGMEYLVARIGLSLGVLLGGPGRWALQVQMRKDKK